MASYSTIGGHGPLFLAAGIAILVGTLPDLLTVTAIYGVAVITPDFGGAQFKVTSTLAVMISARFTY